MRIEFIEDPSFVDALPAVISGKFVTDDSDHRDKETILRTNYSAHSGKQNYPQIAQIHAESLNWHSAALRG
jgi:hypothetical protein